MIIKVLTENTSISEEFDSEHGLSLYIEANGHKILFDVGASGLFLENAEKLDVDVSDIQFLIISHGHYDHGGGLRAFLEENTKARVFLHGLAFEKYYALRSDDTRHYIGLEEDLKQNSQIVFTSDRFFIDEGIQVFSNIVKRGPGPASNSSLFMEQNNQTVKDVFAHEQILIIEEEGKAFLITGCAHNGIVNILQHAHDLTGRMPDYVIGGFHLSGSSPASGESPESIDKISTLLMDAGAKYYTCHCTGLEAYNRMEAVMGDRIEYLSAGRVITI